MIQPRCVLTMVFAALTALAVGCGTNDPPEVGTIHGNLITQGTATRPDTGTVQVSLFADWDTTKGLSTYAPGGMPAFFSEYVVQGVTEYRIENITFGEYAAVAASWRDTTRSGAEATTTTGAWGANPAENDTTPAPVVLNENNADLELDIYVDYGRIEPPPTSGSISGTLTLNGTWPAQPVYLVVLDMVGPAPAFPPMGQPVAMAPVSQFSGTTNYTIQAVPFGEHAMVGAYLFTPPSTFTFAGAYGVDLGGGDTTPESVTLSVDQSSLVNVDFIIAP